LEHHDETIWLTALRQGDESVFDAVFRRYYEPLCRYACRMLGGDMAEAEDLVQQSFVKLWDRRSELQLQLSVKAYLYRAVHNASLNRLRHEKIKVKYQTIKSRQLDQQHETQDTHSRELLERLRDALQTLPPQCRQIFELSRFDELKYREIAEQLDISIKTVETQMGKALRLMRTQLADYLVLLAGAWPLLQLLSSCFYTLSPVLSV
jgi:RNA polymerase sigma-70 factor, ECF subfamily